MTVMLTVDRQRGTLLGLAIGDALGAAVEFMSPETGEQQKFVRQWRETDSPR